MLFQPTISQINFDPNPKSVGFFDIVDEIFYYCEIFEPESKQDEEYKVIWFNKNISTRLNKEKNDRIYHSS